MADSDKPRRGRRRKKKKVGPVELIPAFNHVLRRQILRRLQDSARALSPNDLAKQMEVPLSSISYHVNVLRKHRTVRQVEQRQVRGTIEHFYVSTVEGNPTAQALLEETREEDEGRE